MQSTTNVIHHPNTHCVLVVHHDAHPPCGPSFRWEPQILVRAPQGTRTREFLAMLHRLAAEVEQATQESETWQVRVDRGGDCLGADGRVFLEISRTDDAAGAEAIRGLLTLRKAVREG